MEATYSSETLFDFQELHDVISVQYRTILTTNLKFHEEKAGAK
jgi:hypothetical protein